MTNKILPFVRAKMNKNPWESPDTPLYLDEARLLIERAAAMIEAAKRHDSAFAKNTYDLWLPDLLDILGDIEQFQKEREESE